MPCSLLFAICVDGFQKPFQTPGLICQSCLHCPGFKISHLHGAYQLRLTAMTLSKSMLILKQEFLLIQVTCAV